MSGGTDLLSNTRPSAGKPPLLRSHTWCNPSYPCSPTHSSQIQKLLAICHCLRPSFYPPMVPCCIFDLLQILKCA